GPIFSWILWFYFPCFFFFSSRRRHTRFSRDWSSDVCSSDLGAARLGGGAGGHHQRLRGGAGRLLRPCARGPRGGGPADLQPLARSEERRVGKECRSRRSPER